MQGDSVKITQIWSTANKGRTTKNGILTTQKFGFPDILEQQTHDEKKNASVR